MSHIPIFLNKLFLNTCTKKLFYQAKIRSNTSRNIFISFVLPKKVSFQLSDIGEGIREVIVKEWFVNVGDKVSQFDNICEVQSDKASVTITSRYDGVITKLHYRIDDVALVGQPLIDLETDETAIENEINDKPTQPEPYEHPVIHPEVNTEEARTDFSNTSSSSDEDSIQCIPSVRRLAKEHGIDLTKVIGTGKHNRILKEDILKYIKETKPVSQKLPAKRAGDDDIIIIEPIEGFRKAMWKTMTEALKIPHFGYSDEIKVTKLSNIRRDLKELPEIDVKLTFLPFFIKAASNALQRYPIINSRIDEKGENIVYRKYHNIGVAMATNQGLAVPVIKNVESLTILEVAKELNRFTKSGRDGLFSPSDLSGGTFSISNIGIVGGTYTVPVILPPQVAIIAIGITQVLPRFDDTGNIIKEEIINISASADHRIIDGVSMASFIKTIKKQIENPHLLFLNL